MAPSTPPSTPEARPERARNLRWDINMLRAKAGLSSNMAVPRRVAQKTRQKLAVKKRAGTAQAVGGDVVRGRLNELQRLQAERRLFHYAKLLQVCTRGHAASAELTLTRPSTPRPHPLAYVLWRL